MSPALNPLRGASTAKTSRWLAIEMPRRQTASFRCDKMKLRSSGVPRLVNTCATDSTNLEKSIASSSGVPILERNAEPKLTNSCRKKLPSLQPRGHVKGPAAFFARKIRQIEFLTFDLCLGNSRELSTRGHTAYWIGVSLSTGPVVMGIHGLMKLIGDYAPSAMKENEIKSYFGECSILKLIYSNCMHERCGFFPDRS